MGFRARKSIKLAPGVRMTVTPKSVGLSAGPRGARVSANTRGRVTQSVGIPGSGVSHVSTLKSGSSSRKTTTTPRTRSAKTQAPQEAAPPPKPGLFAPRWEKDLYRALVTNPNAQDLGKVGEQHVSARNIAAIYESVLYAIPAGHHQRARALIEEAYSEGFDPSTDPFLTKYLPKGTVTLGITDQVTVTLPLDRDAVGLLLAELRQQESDIAGATAVTEALTPTTITAVSLAELYIEQRRWTDVVDMTEALHNEDEPTTYLLIQRGIALREQGYANASRESFKEALRVRSRPANLKHLALVERGRTNLADGKKAMARKDFERALAEDSRYPGLKELLDSIAQV